MLNKLLHMIRRYNMVQPGDTVICAVSGGADSIALLFAMYLLREKLEIQVQAAHFNHHLRGAESDRDEAFVKSFCDGYGIRLTIGGGSVVAGEKGLEAAARDARYAFLESLPGKIATAHTADDNAETVLMHMVRGTGLKGLGAIAPVRERVIRPMLLATRQQVLSFLKEYNLDYVEDSSNATDAFLRNRLRHNVMPILRQENPKLAENLSAMAMRLREDEAALEIQRDYSKGLELAAVRTAAPAVRSRMLAAFLKFCGIKEPGAQHIALAEGLAFSENPSARASFPGNITVIRQYDRLIPHITRPQVETMVLRCPGEVIIRELGLRVVCAPADEILNTENVFTVAAEGEILVRGRLPGDSIRLSGGTKTLKKLFIDRKIPAEDRPRVPVVGDDEGVLGVYGFGVNRNRAAQSLPAVQISFQAINTDKRKISF